MPFSTTRNGIGVQRLFDYPSCPTITQRCHPGLPTWTNLEAPTFYATRTRKALQLLDQRFRTIHRLLLLSGFFLFLGIHLSGTHSSSHSRPRPRFVVCLLSSRDLASSPTRGSHCPCDIRPISTAQEPAASTTRIALVCPSISHSSHCACECAPSGTGRPFCLILIILPGHVVYASCASTRR